MNRAVEKENKEVILDDCVFLHRALSRLEMIAD